MMTEKQASYINSLLKSREYDYTPIISAFKSGFELSPKETEPKSVATPQTVADLPATSASSILVEIPAELHDQLFQFMQANPDWDGDRIFTTALSMFLMQSGNDP